MRGSLRCHAPVRLVLVALTYFAVGPLCFGADEVFDARGLNAKRGSENPLPFEHIDPLTGNLTLTFTDLTLPGDAGFDLRLQRTYNSKIHTNDTFGALDSDSWAGVGWIFHLGRVATTSGGVPLAVEMPDGSSHKLFPNFVGNSGLFVTRDYWLYDRNTTPPKLRTTNGVVYTFDKVVDFSSGNGIYYRYPTRIEDAFGNYITITYPNPTLAQAPDAFSTITQYVGGNSRVITFGTQTSGTRTRLRTMAYAGRTWTYGYISSNEGNKSLLTSVTPPAGPAWSFSYDMTSGVKHELVKATAPWGGTISYTYGTQGAGSGVLSSPFYLGSTVPVKSRVVTARTTGGTDVVAGTHTYAYAQGTARNKSIFTRPTSCATNAVGTSQSVVTTYTFLGVGNYSTTGSVWKIGLLDTREVKQAGAVIESDHLTWRAPAATDYVSPAIETVGNNQDAGIYAPVVATRTITRGPRTYTTTNTYHSQAYAANGPNFNDYGRPYRVVETGEAGTRTTNLGYKYGLTPYIKDRVESETVTVGSESFGSSYAYATATGFKTSETIRGITTTFTPTSDGRGNTWKVRDAHNHERVFTYSHGRANRAQTPMYNPLWTRVINADGTVQSETRRGFTTGFQYDDLMRPTKTTPPVGNATNATYDLLSGGQYYSRTTRGSSQVDVFVDGFGRPSSTRNGLGLATDTSYDACGQKTYESVPYCLSGYAACAVARSNTGVQSRFDGLGRLVRRVNTADSSVATYTYSNGIDVSIQDEESRTTEQNWSAFSDPDDAWLTSVTDARSKTWTYSYNALGSLKSVSPPEGGARTWTYFGTTGLLKSETHPEGGTVNYTYDSAGRLSTRTDPQFGGTTYLYDQDDRAAGVDRTGTEHDVSQTWDASNNRLTLNAANVNSTFTYDGANRLRSRTDVVGGRSFSTVYTPDANDNIDILQYPSGNTVDYDYDAENRVAKVLNGARTKTYADAFTFHPSGGILSFKPGGAGNATQSFTYDSRYRLATISTGRRSLAYSHNRVGNVTSVTDSRPNKSRTSIGYDAVDRLTSVAGFGAGTYTYDALGNRKTSTVGGAITYTYQAATGRLTSHTGSGTFGYDNNGNQTSDGVQVFGYTPDNMLKSVGGIQYDYDGDLLRKRRSGASGAKRYYIHGPGNEILSEFEDACAGAATPQLVRDYVYAGGRLIAAVKPATPPAQVRFSSATSNANEGSGVASVGVQVVTWNGGATVCPVTVRYNTSDGTGLAGTDYSASSGTLTFAAGSANGAVQTASVSLVNDNACKGNRTFSLQLSDPQGATLTPSAPTHTVTKVEDDLVCIVGSKSVSGSHTPAGGSVVYAVTLTNTGSQAQGNLGGNEFTDAISNDLTLMSATASSGTASTSGNTATWNGSIAAGGSVTITLNAQTKAGTEGRVVTNQGTFLYDLHGQGTNDTTGLTNEVGSQVGSGTTSFYAVTPCRVLDTRSPDGEYGGPALAAGAPRAFTVHGTCGIPAAAKAISVNVTVVGATADGTVTFYAAGIGRPPTSTVNYATGQVRANNAVVTVNAGNGKVAGFAGQASGTVHVIVDVNGYFQ